MQLGVGLSVVTETRFPDEHTFVSVPVGAEVTGKYENLDAAVRRLELAMTPCSYDAAESLVTILQVATASAKRSPEGAEVAFDLYANTLRRYPADVARQACENIATGKDGVAWWPTLAEVVKECEALGGYRLAMLNGLKAWQEAPPQIEKGMDRLDWLHAAAQADEELMGFPKPDPERQSELKEFIAVCHAKAKELRT